MMVALDTAIVRRRATVVPMGSQHASGACARRDDRSDNDLRRRDASWTEEGATLPESEAKFGRVLLRASKLTMRGDVPNELLQDRAPGIDAVLQRIFGASMGFEEHGAFLVGSGVGRPLGG